MTMLHKNITALCKAHDISVLELERQLKFPKNTISTWRKKLPLCERIIIVADYFNISVDYLIGRNPNMIPDEAIHNDATIKLIHTARELQLSDEATEIAVQMLVLLKKLC